jgi:nicotinate-nucleotide--dimethylbenzimidazole phosphoribosyltransferase
MMRDTEHERGSSNAGLDPSSSTIASGPVASAYDDADDDSPPPTHFVEIKLPPVVPAEAQRPALPEESIAESTPAPAPIEPEQAPTAAPAPALSAARHANAPPKISLELPADSALVMVETSHQKAQTPMSDEPKAPEAPRPRRVRPPRIEVTEGPLQLVETAPKEPTPPGV